MTTTPDTPTRAPMTEVRLRIPPELLDRVDALARRMHTTRSHLLRLWAAEGLDRWKVADGE